MSDSIRRFGEKLYELLGTEPSKKRIIKTALEGFDAVKTNKKKSQEKIEMEIVMLNGRINIKRIWNDLDKFEMNKLEAKQNAEIEILEEREKQARKNIKKHRNIKT